MTTEHFADSSARVIRGCGVRMAGGIYSCCTLSENGLPLEHFLYDPPLPVSPKDMGITPVGVELIQRDGAWHILDWIGSQHYPNVADFLEEARRFGLSRRLPRTLDYAKLTSASRHIVMHARGWIVDRTAYYDRRATTVSRWYQPRTTTDYRCPKEAVATHPRVSPSARVKAEMTAQAHQGWPRRLSLVDAEEPPSAAQAYDTLCASLWWEDVDDGAGNEHYGARFVREQPSFHYDAIAPPNAVTDWSAATRAKNYRPAMIARFPITHIAVVRDPEDAAREQDAINRASAAGVAVHLEDE